MDIVAASVHLARHLRSILDLLLVVKGQGIQVGAKGNDRSGPLRSDRGNDPGGRDEPVRDPEPFELGTNAARCFELLETQLRRTMELAPDGNHPGEFIACGLQDSIEREVGGPDLCRIDLDLGHEPAQ